MSAARYAKALRQAERGQISPGQIDTYGLVGYRVASLQETVDEYHVVLVLEGKPAGCVHCPSTEIRSWGSKIQCFADEPLHAKPCKVAIDRHRYRCTTCKHYFSAPLPGLHPRRRMTMRLFRLIREWAATSTFADIAQRVGLNEKTIRNVVRERYHAEA